MKILPRNRHFARLVLMLVATVVVLLVAEALIRMLGRAPDVKPIWITTQESTYQRSTNPILSFELKPNYRNDDPDLIQTYARTNAHGFRDRERTSAKPTGTRRIILLGDSVVEGVGVPDYETMSRHLERLYPDGSTEVLNFGVSGYCTLAEIELLETKGLAFDPDIVILVFVDNDFHNFNREGFALGPIERPALVKHLFLRSHFFRLLAVRANLFHFGAEVDPVARNRSATGDNNVVEGLARMRDLAEQHGFLPLVAVWPAFLDEGIRDPHPMPDDPQDLVIERLARMNAIPTARLSQFFLLASRNAVGDASPRLLYTIGDELHPSPAGNRIAAAALESIVSQLELNEAALPTVRPDSDRSAVITARALGQKEAPSYAVVLVRLGNESLQKSELVKAAKYFRMALVEDSTDADAFNGLGIVQKQQGRLREAEASFDQALRLAPDFFQARFNLAVVLEEQGKLPESLREYERVLSAAPGLAQPRQRIESIRRQLGKPVEQD